MKLKYLVAALGLVASVPSFAAINPNTDTAGEIFLSVWEQGVFGKPDQSFTFDTGVTYASFIANANVSQIWADFTASDPTFFSFLASSDPASLQYAVIGGKGNPSPATLLSTVHVGDEGQVALGTNGQVTGALAQVGTFLSYVNATGTHATLANGESVNLTGDPGYFQDVNNPLQYFNGAFSASPWSNSNLLGQASEFTSIRRKIPGTSATTAIESVLPGTVQFAQVGSDWVLSYTVAAVPEPSGLGMALAGVGLLGFIGLRRKNQG